jgi:opacity protein-like surface antigen
MKKIMSTLIIAIISILIFANIAFSKDLLAYEGIITSEQQTPFYQGFEIKLKGWASKLSGSTSFDPNASYGTTRGTAFTTPNTFDLKDVYGFGGTKTSLQLEVRKEINQRSFGYLSYFTDSRKSEVNLTSPVAFVWNKPSQPNDQTPGITYLSAGNNLSTAIKINTFDIGYGYYIGKKYDKGYLAAIVGLRFNNLAVDWTYSGSLNGSDIYRKRGASGFIGIDGRYNFSDNLVGYLRIDGGITGGGGNRVGLFEYELGANVKLTNSLHLELGYKYADIRAREDIGSKLSLKLQGINGGLVFKF